ncbi:BTB/POZ domain-containing protein [Tanacetum coccineum]
MEVITHFVKTGDNWLSASQQHIILMLSEVGGWPVLAFMVAALSLHKKSYTVENKALKVVHKQVPSDLLLKMIAMNPIPSQLRYLQYVSRRNGDTEWPPPEKALTLNCVIMRIIPDFDGKGGCCPVFRIYGRDPLLHVDRSPKLLFSTPGKRKNIRYYNQAESELVQIDINCNIQVDLSCFEMEGLLEEAFGQVQEMFSSDDWVVPKRSRISDGVRFNVGGKFFETTSTTLAAARRESYFGAMFDENGDIQMNPANEHFIDRNPDCFAVLLDLLRTWELYIPQNVPEKIVYREAMFYGLMDRIRSAKWVPIDGNRLQPSKSVIIHAPGDNTSIRASPDGGCCVAHGSMVHIYDWMLEEYPPINLDYRQVNDAGWVGPVDPTGLVISTCEAGNGLFDSTTGELKYKFDVTHEGVVKSYTSSALTFDDGCNLFSSCKGQSNEYGIGVWDQNTGQQVDFFYEPPGWSLGDADKLQWFNGSNCLLVATLFPRKDNCYISLLDFRSKSMVWSWSDNGSVESSVANGLEDLGFMDFRSDSGSVRWSSRSQLTKGKMPKEPCYPKLALHEGQLFSSTNDRISVFCGSDWVLTSRLKGSIGGSICDISIGGNRLFALYGKDNVFDIWETPPPPIM